MLLCVAAGVLSVSALLLTGTIVVIRSELQHFSDDAVSRFPGDRVTALMRVVDCTSCAVKDRNHAVWALGQMTEERSVPVLKKYLDGQPCSHATRLCQYELKKALQVIDRDKDRTGVLWRMVASLHQPWR